MLKLQELKTQLLETNLLQDNVSVTEVENSLQIVFPDLPEFPINVIIDEVSLRFWTVLASVEEIQEERVTELNSVLLQANSVAELSNFSILDGLYCLNGDLSSKSTFENIVLELNMLVTNTRDSLQNIFLPVVK